MVAEQEGVGIGAREGSRIGSFGGLEQSDGALLLFEKFFLGERRPHQHVGDQLDHELGVTRQEVCGHGDGLHVGAGADTATDRGRRLGKCGRVAIRGALLEERRQQ